LVTRANDSLVGPLHVRLLDPQPDVGGKLDDHPEAVEVVQELHNLHGGERLSVRRSTGILTAVLSVQRIIFTAFPLEDKVSCCPLLKGSDIFCVGTAHC
jgi:hypothetical protein